MTDSPRVTWPSPARTTLPLRRTDKTVVDRISRWVAMSATVDYSSAPEAAHPGGSPCNRSFFRGFQGSFGNQRNRYKCDIYRLRRRPYFVAHAPVCRRSLPRQSIARDAGKYAGRTGNGTDELPFAAAGARIGDAGRMLDLDRGFRPARLRGSDPHGGPAAGAAEAGAAGRGQPGLAGNGPSVSVRRQPHFVQTARQRARPGVTQGCPEINPGQSPPLPAIRGEDAGVSRTGERDAFRDQHRHRRTRLGAAGDRSRADEFEPAVSLPAAGHAHNVARPRGRDLGQRPGPRGLVLFQTGSRRPQALEALAEQAR